MTSSRYAVLQQRFLAAVCTLLACLTLSILWSGGSAAANDSPTSSEFTAVDYSRLGSISAAYYAPQTGAPLPGVKAKLYRIAQLRPDYAAAPEHSAVLQAVGWDKFWREPAKHTVSEWEQLAKTIGDLLVTAAATPQQEAVTGPAGNLIFEQLPVGVYLLLSDSYLDTAAAERYSFQPALLTLPRELSQQTVLPQITEGIAQQLSYDLQVTPKAEREPLGKQLNYRVVKHWSDARNSQLRPAEVTVEIFRDGKHFTTQVLHAGNNWSYSWEDLSQQHQWTVAEKNTHQYYTVSNTQQGSTFIITNTLKPEIPKLSDTGALSGGIWFAPLALCAAGIIVISWRRVNKEQN